MEAVLPAQDQEVAVDQVEVVPDHLLVSKDELLMRSINLVFIILILSSGCYTVLKHPKIVSDESSQDYRQQVYYTDDCSSCHNKRSSALRNWFASEYPQPDYINNQSRWNFYYHSPWWHRDIFSKSRLINKKTESNNPLPTTSSRNRFPGAGESSTTITNSNPTRISSGSTSSTPITTGNKTGEKSESKNINTADKKQNTRQTEKNNTSDKTDSDKTRKVNREKK